MITVTFPAPAGYPDQFELHPGRPLVFVGANGSGKSALAQHLNSQLQVSGANTNMVRAHRALTMRSASRNATSQARAERYSTQFSYNMQPTARWLDSDPNFQVSKILADLIDHQAAIDSQIADSLRGGLVRQENLNGPLQYLNEIFEAFPSPFTLQVASSGEIEATRGDSSPYSVAHMSDGEKSAVLLCADVLVEPDSTVHILDEPERHLHRAISTSLIQSMLALRSADYFIIFTHDLDLASALGRIGQIVVLEGCEWRNNEPASWSTHLSEMSFEHEEAIREAILGSRHRVAFVEGSSGSLDQQVYKAILPSWNIVPAGGCSDVLRCTKGVINASDLHWINARGIVDKDFRTEEPDSSVSLIKVHEIENLFFIEPVMQAMIQQQVNVLGVSRTEVDRSVENAWLTLVRDRDRQTRFAQQCALELVRRDLTAQVQRIRAVPDQTPVAVTASVDVTSIADDVTRLLSTAQYDKYLAKYPIRESPLPDLICKAMKFPSLPIYQNAVVTRLRRDALLRNEVIRVLGLEMFNVD